MEALQTQLWRQASPTRKMHMLAQFNASARLLAQAGLRSQYPQASEAKIRRRLAGLLLGEDLAGKVYGEISHATEMHFEGNGIEHPHPDYPTSQLSD